MVSVTPSRKGTRFRMWARLSTLVKGERADLPLQAYAQPTARAGNRALTVQVNQWQAGSFGVDILSDAADALAAYRPRCEALALDLGLNTLFATDLGDLAGRQWRAKVEHHDRRITELATYLHNRGLKPNRSARYRARVSAQRGWAHFPHAIRKPRLSGLLNADGAVIDCSQNSIMTLQGWEPWVETDDLDVSTCQKTDTGRHVSEYIRIKVREKS
jgi:hypothetical protein